MSSVKMAAILVSGNELFMATYLSMQSYNTGKPVPTDHTIFAYYSKLTEFVAGKNGGTL